jgi:quercetin dioxygenase-like cupin family protein
MGGFLMKVFNYKDVKAEPMHGEEEAKGVSMRWLISDKDGAPTFAMRMVDVEPDGHTPYHIHPWEHETFILKGTGVVKSEEGEKHFKAGDVVYIPPSEQHNFRNTGKETLQFLCLIPWPTPKST